MKPQFNSFSLDGSRYHQIQLSSLNKELREKDTLLCTFTWPPPTSVMMQGWGWRAQHILFQMSEFRAWAQESFCWMQTVFSSLRLRLSRRVCHRSTDQHTDTRGRKKQICQCADFCLFGQIISLLQTFHQGLLKCHRNLYVESVSMSNKVSQGNKKSVNVIILEEVLLEVIDGCASE